MKGRKQILIPHHLQLCRNTHPCKDNKSRNLVDPIWNLKKYFQLQRLALAWHVKTENKDTEARLGLNS